MTAAMFPLKMSVFGDAAGCCGGGARTLRAGYPLCVAVLDFLRVHYAGSGVRRPSVCQYDPTLESGVRLGWSFGYRSHLGGVLPLKWIECQ